MTLGLADPKAAAQSVTRLEDAFRQLRYGEAVKTASEGLYLCQRLLKADQPAIAAEAYDLSLACHPLQGTFQQTIAWEFFEHELDQLLTGVEEENTPPAYHPGEEVEEISPETPKGKTVDFVRASLEAVGGKTNLLVSATANWNVVDDSETPPGHDVLVSAFSPGLDIYPIWQPSNLPAVGTMETVVFSVVPTAEGPWTVSVTFHDAKDFRRMEQVYVHISADRVSVPS